MTTSFLLWFSAVSFFVFGSGCFLSAYMRREFDRYGLSGYRHLVGALQIMGACGLVVGTQLPWIGQLASAGLAVLMLLGVGVRVRIKDTLPQILPALFYMGLNAYLCLTAFRHP